MKYVEFEMYGWPCDRPMLTDSFHHPNAPSHETIIDSSLPSHPGCLSMVIKVQIEGIDTGGPLLLVTSKSDLVWERRDQSPGEGRSGTPAHRY